MTMKRFSQTFTFEKELGYEIPSTSISSLVTQLDDHDHRQNKRFEYPPIDPQTQVRLLRIVRATKSNVEGYFKAVSIKDLSKHNYIALSYTWGQARTNVDVHCITLAGQDFYIRDNLWNFLTSTKNSYNNALFYIDAICVNQLNNQERGYQVQKMAEIYAKANYVCVWLGKPLADQHENLKALDKLLRVPDLQPAQLRNVDRHAMFGFENVLASSYWTRLWVIQELLLAGYIMVCYGEWRFEWDKLAKLRRDLSESELDVHTTLVWWNVTAFGNPTASTFQQDAEKHLSGRWEPALRIFTHRARWRSASGYPLYKAVDWFKKQDCGELKDKIYALVGLLERSEQNAIVPNYNRDCAEIYAEALKVGLLTLQRDIEPLALAAGYYPEEDYEKFAEMLRTVLKLDSRSVQGLTVKAFQTDAFRANFVAHCRDERGDDWPSDRRKDETESSIAHDFFMFTQGKVSSGKVFKLHLDITGKSHIPSATLTAARFGLFDRRAVMFQEKKQSALFRSMYWTSEVWRRATRFRSWKPWGH